jgi:hypothetical protein
LGWRRAELVTLLPVTPAAQKRGVVRRKHRAAALTATPPGHTGGSAPPLWTWSTHPIPPRWTPIYRWPAYIRPPTQPTSMRCTPKWAPTRRYSDNDLEHAQLDIDPATAWRDGLVARGHPAETGGPEPLRCTAQDLIRGRYPTMAAPRTAPRNP